MMRTFALLAVVIGLVAAAGPAAACLPYPPPYWLNLLREGGPTVVVGRVVSVTTNAELQDNPFLEVEEATAEIEAVEWLQGSGASVFKYVAATDVRERPGVRNNGWCGAFMTLKPGDIVVAVWARPNVIQVFESSSLPADWQARVESYR